MIKKLLFAATAFVAISMSANAQTVLLEEDFENIDSWTDETSWEIFDATGQSLNWGIYNAGEFTEEGLPTQVAGSASFYMVGETPTPYEVNNYIISPSISIPEDDDQITLTFDSGAFVALEEEGEALNFNVVAFIDSEDSEEHLVYSGSFPSPTTEANSVDVDLSDYNFSGEDIVIAFQHIGSTVFGYVLIDNVLVTSSSSSSTDNFAKLGLNVFPNPVSDVMNITSPEANIQAVTITDLNGRTVKSINFNNVAETTVDASDLASGVYLMNITANGTVATHKIVKK